KQHPEEEHDDQRRRDREKPGLRHVMRARPSPRTRPFIRSITAGRNQRFFAIMLWAWLLNGLPRSADEMSVMAFCPRTLLPAESNGGETTAMPNLSGETAIKPPPTPLFAGRPVT